jgi:hypothetical protein
MWSMQIIIYYTNVVDRHADLDPTSFLIPIQIRTGSGSYSPPPSFTHNRKSEEKKLILIHSRAGINCFIFLVSVIGVKVFYILDSILKFSGKIV